MRTPLVLAFVLAACGGSSKSTPDAPPQPDAVSIDAPVDSIVQPGGGSNAGSGTATLVVTGAVIATPSVANASSPTSFTSDITVRVQKGGVDVTTGTVTVTSNGGAVSLLFDATLMRWHGAQAGYYEVYSLDVTSGADTVTGVRVDGPDIHTFTAPMENATVDSTMPLPVTWAKTETADTAFIQTRQLNRTTISDTGTYSLAAGSLRSKPDQTENERIDLTRADVITPAGGAAGSLFTVAVTNEIDLIVQATM
jgi:hypothetical protein